MECTVAHSSKGVMVAEQFLYSSLVVSLKQTNLVAQPRYKVYPEQVCMDQTRICSTCIQQPWSLCTYRLALSDRLVAARHIPN